MKRLNIAYWASVLLICLSITGFANSKYDKKMVREINLSGTWKFSIMFDDNWKNEGYNDSDWDELRVPRKWEEQGYDGYNGYGFYRREVTIPAGLVENQLILDLGYIDDVDEVYVNGTLIGSSGSFPPNYKTSFNARRSYVLPESVLKFGENNTIAVKVFDMEGEGGIVKGEPGIYIQEFPVKLKINLIGQWKFKTRNKDEYKESDFDDSDWDNIMVPGEWENQGYRNYDGCAWYRKTFQATKKLEGDYLVMMAGRIDDIDKVYLNGTWIGQTGENDDFKWCEDGQNGNYFESERAYVFPASLLKSGKNVIAIHVVDGRGAGGIYDGPVGIIEQPEFVNYWKKRSQNMRKHGNRDW